MACMEVDNLLQMVREPPHQRKVARPTRSNIRDQREIHGRFARNNEEEGCRCRDAKSRPYDGCMRRGSVHDNKAAPVARLFPSGI